uniref:Uncharacterized protein n=1 Tax=Chromera velia CCMP2878 TaxID=1169474 RepID=A0A0G4HH26_9ALVE|eukprot:Cvel_6832.t1-p1 / transcript=Cvel_6832.t1 / gene=Cvel_6832 / organism=Chromera_velia_CCMP2878 / gene_product=hypothetical protein / transcript_product=hypothetical protein / location=Cvel_scaffold344:91334-91762(-) / protein_length=143 / sequence_SO=supercontig / SO=protein_coding / is_pseudo=false
MEDVIVQAGDIEWEITDKQKVNAFVGALSLEQKKEYLRDHRLQRGGVKIADLNELTWEELEDGIKFYVSIEKLEDKHRRGRQDGRAHHPRREETAFTIRGQHHSHHHHRQGQQQREQSRGRAMSATGGWQEVRGRSRSQSRGP